MAAKKKQTRAKNPHHERDAAKGFQVEDYSTLSYLHRASLAVADTAKKSTATVKKALDINILMALLAQYGPLIAGLIQQLTKKPDQPVVPPVVNPVTPPVVPPVPQPPPVSARRISGGKSHILGVEGWSPSKQHFSLGGGTVRNIASGNEFCGAGYRIHLDSTPVDQNRKPFYNSDLHAQPDLFAQDPTQVQQDGFGKWTCGEGNNRINHYVTVDGVEYGPQGDMVPGTPFDQQEVVDLSSEYDDAACTPVLVVPQDIELSQEHSVSYRAEHVAADGTVTAFEASPTFKVKAWGF
jgi:hypothetical protein